MKILSVAEKRSGSAYYRQYVPFRAMAQAGYPVSLIDNPYAPPSAIIAHDVIQVLRIASHDAGPALKQIRELQHFGKKIVVDYDDDLIGIPEHNPAHRGVTPDEVIRALKEVDAITVTSEALAKVYRPYAKKIGIIPNYVDVKRWPKAEPREGITIGLVGSASHHEDWKLIARAMFHIRQKYPDVRFLVAGYMPGYLADIATEFVGWQPIAEYQKTVNRIDIGLCPLTGCDFNKRKTPVKAMEYAMAGAAVVASTGLYSDMVTRRGMIARYEHNWFEAIELYILDADRRHRDATELHNYVQLHYDVVSHAHEIYSTYRKLLATPRPNAANPRPHRKLQDRR